MMAKPVSLNAQPVPKIQSSQLPAVGSENSSQFPDAPSTDVAMASPGMNGNLEAQSMDVTKESLVGGWMVNKGTSSCSMFLTLTNLGSGSRGGTKGCVGELTAMNSWDVAGKKVVLKDREGNEIGNLYKVGDNSFAGSTKSGREITLSR